MREKSKWYIGLQQLQYSTLNFDKLYGVSTVFVFFLTQVGDGIALIDGLDEVMAGELIEFEEGTISIALNLESNHVGNFSSFFKY